MKLIMISRDVKVLDATSEVYSRLVEYANLFDRLDVVVMGKKPKSRILENSASLHIYDATSIFLPFTLIKTFLKTLSVSKKNASTWVTSQDPFESGLVAHMVARIRKIKLQLQLHTDCFNELFIKQRFANYFKVLLARMILGRADAIRVVSKRIKNSMRGLKLRGRIYVLPIWTDIKKITSKPLDQDLDLKIKFPEYSKHIVIVARLESEKNIELALKAFAKMLRFNNSLGLFIVGDGSQMKWLKEYTKSLGIQEKVRFLGWVKDPSTILKTADLLLVTSLYEGYGLNMVEAAAIGLPIVSTDVGVAPELGASLVPYDAGEIALKTIEVLGQGKKPSLPKEFMLSKQEYMDKFRDTFTI